MIVNREQRPYITVVSGLPRSGTSMMMRMLEAGGIPPLTDGRRAADPDNPRGYFEHEGVKRLAQDSSFIPRARGMAIKVISELLYHLPEGETYRVIFLRRRIEEILRSQTEMLRRRGTLGEGGPSDEKMAPILMKSALKAMNYAVDRPDMKLLVVGHHAAFQDTAATVARVDDFLGGGLSRAAMAAVVDPALYRQRME
jgi:hypothetical protein